MISSLEMEKMMRIMEITIITLLLNAKKIDKIIFTSQRL